MYCYSSENYQNLIDLIHTKKCTLSTVIEDPGFVTALRNDSPDLINFLTQETELQTIIEYALSGDIEEKVDPIEYKKMMRHSIFILTSSSRKLQNFLIENKYYLQYLHNFPLSRAINSSILCANYAKIIDFLISNSQKKFLDADYSNLINTLIEHIDILSFQMLFIKICCDYLTNFNQSYEVMKELLNSTKDIPKIYTLTKIVNDKPSLIPFLNIPEFLQPLYEIVVRTYENEHFLCTETCELLLIIIKATQPNNLADEYEDQYGQRIDFTQPLNYSSATVLSLFPKYVDYFIERFFMNQEQCTTQVNQSILDALRKKDRSELKSIATKYKVFTKIMDTYPLYLKHKVNGHFFQVIQLFISNKIECDNLEKVRWESFIQEEKFSERYQNIFNGRSLKEFFPIHSQPLIHDEPSDPINSKSFSNSDSNVNRGRQRCKSQMNMKHSNFFSSSAESSSSSSGSESDTTLRQVIVRNITLPPPARPEKKSKHFNITRISSSAQSTTSSSSRISLINDSTILNQQHHQSTVNPIKIEVTAEIIDPDKERKLMSQSLDQNAMRYIKSRFIITHKTDNSNF